MTGHDVLALAGAAAVGAALGAVYFIGLWRTVRALPQIRQPGLIALGSFVLRFAVLAVVFLLLVREGGWRLMAAGLGGFLLARGLVIGRLRVPDERAKEGRPR